MLSKTCSRCKSVLSATPVFFSPLRRSTTDGLHSWCKPCSAAWRRDDRKLNPDRYKQIEKERHVRSKEKRNFLNRARRNLSLELSRQKERMRALPNRSAYNAQRRERFEKSPNLRAERSKSNKAWREANAEANNLRRREAWAKKSPSLKLRTSFGASISHSLQGKTKGGRSWQAILGYKTDDLRKHLERQFSKEMTWDNYGEWHVDHILPVTFFSYSDADDPEFKACWALTNLRPLWSGENIRKRDKRLLLL